MSTAAVLGGERREIATAADRELVTAVRGGDDGAFGALYDRYRRRVAAYVYGMVGDYARAEDITQEVFIAALRRMRETERPIAFRPWIYEIAKNACIDQFRRARRTEEVSFDADGGVGPLDHARLAAFERGPDDAMDAKQRLDHLCGAFGGLSATHHEILVLRELEGLSYREIGERMGLSRPSVESTLFRARRRLSQEFDELSSGERCVAVQGMIVGASGKLGLRDRHRLARHLAHCQPCRRDARLAGVDVAAAPRRPVRDAVAAKVAGLVPLPLLLRGRRDGDVDAGVAAGSSAPLGGMAEPVAAWAKAVAAAATLLIAGTGAGGDGLPAVIGDAGGARAVETQGGGHRHDHEHAHEHLHAHARAAGPAAPRAVPSHRLTAAAAPVTRPLAVAPDGDRAARGLDRPAGGGGGEAGEGDVDAPSAPLLGPVVAPPPEPVVTEPRAPVEHDGSAPGELELPAAAVEAAAPAPPPVVDPGAVESLGAAVPAG